MSERALVWIDAEGHKAVDVLVREGPAAVRDCGAASSISWWTPRSTHATTTG